MSGFSRRFHFTTTRHSVWNNPSPTKTPAHSTNIFALSARAATVRSSQPRRADSRRIRTTSGLSVEAGGVSPTAANSASRSARFAARGIRYLYTAPMRATRVVLVAGVIIPRRIAISSSNASSRAAITSMSFVASHSLLTDRILAGSTVASSRKGKRVSRVRPTTLARVLTIEHIECESLPGIAVLEGIWPPPIRRVEIRVADRSRGRARRRSGARFLMRVPTVR